MAAKFILASVAALTMAGTAHAQFKELGKKLLDKAKDEVESALSKEADDPKEDDSADVKEPPAPDEAPANCHEISSSKGADAPAPFTTRFTLCDNQPSWIRLNVREVNKHPEISDYMTPAAKIALSVRSPGVNIETVNEKGWGNDHAPHSGYAVPLPDYDEALRLAKAVNAGETITITATNKSSGEAHTVFSGVFAMTFPAAALSGGGDDQPKSQAQASAAPSALAAKKTAQSGSTKVSYTDPAGEACARDSYLTSRLYDCGCIDSKAPQIREDLSDKRVAKAQEGEIQYRENQLRVAEERLAKETDPQRIESMKRSVERAKERLDELKKRPDPMSHSPELVAQYAYQAAACKIGDYFRETEKKNCLNAYSSSVTDPDSYCACSADKAAELWLQSGDQQYGSTLATQIVTQARQACRGRD